MNNLLLLVAMWMFAGFASAEGNCPEGQYPIGDNAVQGCAPIPGYAASSSTEQSQPLWVTRWGAIAFDGDKGVLGAVTGAKSKKLANKAAIAQCRANGGGDNCKKSAFSYYNQCAAIAWGDSTYRGGGRPTLEEAKRDAMQSCSNATTSCKIVYAGCSPPERVQ